MGARFQTVTLSIINEMITFHLLIYNEKPATVVPLASCGKLAACGMDVDGKDGVVILGGKSIKHTIQRMEEKRLIIWRKTNRAQIRRKQTDLGNPAWF